MSTASFLLRKSTISIPILESISFIIISTAVVFVVSMWCLASTISAIFTPAFGVSFYYFVLSVMIFGVSSIITFVLFIPNLFLPTSIMRMTLLPPSFGLYRLHTTAVIITVRGLLFTGRVTAGLIWLVLDDLNRLQMLRFPAVDQNWQFSPEPTNRNHLVLVIPGHISHRHLKVHL